VKEVPVYTCTTVDSALDASSKAALAGEIARIHSDINHVPSTYVTVVFHGLPADSVYTDGRPAVPLLVNGWVRNGLPEADTTHLALEIASAATRVTGIPAERVMVVFESSPAHYAVEAGRVLPRPGEEAAWVAAGTGRGQTCRRVAATAPRC
jgi:phenylpyruvate tautomerase PptA (4-oxalocrotonate tautomerase family)